MSLCTWNDGMNIGNATVDTQHQHLVALINKLHEAMLEGKAKETVGPLLNDLVSYTRSHFAAEERLMVSSQYPRYAQHKQIHDEFAKTIQEFQAKFQSGSTHLTVQLLMTLKDWLVNHIKGEDSLIGQFLQKP